MSPIRYNRVPESYWVLSRTWSDKLRNLGLYVQTCKHRTGEGLYHLPIAYAANDLGWTVAVAQKHMRELAEVGFVSWDAKAEVVLLHNALEIQAPTTEKQIKGAIERLKTVPPSQLLSVLYRLAQVHANGLADSIRMAFPNTFEWVSEPGSNGHSNSHAHALAHAHTHAHSPSPLPES